MGNNPINFNDPTGHKECDYKCQIKYEGADPAYEHYGEGLKWDVGKQRKNEKIAKAILEDGTELITSILFEPADWAYSTYHCANGDCSPLMLLGLLPIIPATLGSHGDDAIDLYRAVSKSEMDDIVSTGGSFRPRPDGRSMDTKWFWETLDGAKAWAQKKGLDNILEVKAPRSVLDLASQRWSNLDQLGPAVGFIDDGLDAFNDAIIAIRSIWST